MYYTYVLFSPAFDQIYVGFSADPETRLLSHNELAKKGWTIRYRPWTMIHKEPFQTKSEAMKREKELKSARGRVWIREHLIPRWKSSNENVNVPPADSQDFPNQSTQIR